MITFVFLIISVKCIDGSIYMTVDFQNKTEVDMYHKYVNALCKVRENICKVDLKTVCAVRKKDNVMEYKEFENSCHVFMHNFCNSTDQEYYIVGSGKCHTFIKSRKNGDAPPETEVNAEDVQATTDGNIEVTTSTVEGNSETEITTENENEITTEDENEITTEETTADDIANTTKPVLRKKGSTKFVPLYEVDEAFDDHICPLSCPNIYSPVCVSANRGNGLYFKFWTFVNHCSGDLYYCKNPDEFAPAPDESEEDVNASKLGWSYCGASRYLQFARFSESASSLGYYGWLAGDKKYSHIMEPHERKPGYG